MENKPKNKIVKGKPYLNKFHEEHTKKALEAVKSNQNRSRSWEFMKEQAEWLENRFKKQ